MTAPTPLPVPSPSAPRTPVEICATGLSKAFGPVQVFEDVTLVAAPGHRVGIVGENGAGKSTLLSILSGTLDPDLGTITRPDGTGYLHQEFPFPPDTDVGAVLDAALAPARAAEAELTAAAASLGGDPTDGIGGAALHRYELALATAEQIDVWDAERRADVVVDGLGLRRCGRERTVGSLSGGERTRLELATLLIAHPPAMVLDEPTNHLDDEAVDFLTSFLVGFPGPIVTASHDRLFLEQVCTGIVDLDGGREGIRTYGGSFERYLELKGRERVHWAQQWSQEQDELAALRHNVTDIAPRVSHFAPRRDNDKMQYGYHGNRVNAQISRRVRNVKERLADLEARQVRKPPIALHFDPPPGVDRDGHEPLITAVGVSLTGRLAAVDVAVDRATRLLVSGANGAGKSTLLAILAQALSPDGGLLTRKKGLRVGYLPQDVVFDEPELSPTQVFAAAGRRGADATTLTDLGLLSGRDLERPVGLLSVGQRRRVALGCIVASRPDVLLMDEPTNHLSLTLAEELEDALMTTLGAVVVASHDRWLRRRWNGDELPIVAQR